MRREDSKRPFLVEGIMRSKLSSRKFLYPVMLLALLSTAFFISSCRTDEPAVPPLTGPSGARLYITVQANPEDLVIHAPKNTRETSIIRISLQNAQGIGVPGEGIKLRITNADGSIVNIGTLSDYNVTTDRAGFAEVTYIAPNTSEQSRAIRIYILAILTNPAYANEVTGRHALDLEASSVDPGDCLFDYPGAPTPSFTVSGDPTINFPVCFSAEGSEPGSSAIVEWRWSFGDGATTGGGQAFENVCHTYDGFGIFNVQLLVKDANRNCAITQQSVDVSRGDPATCNILVSPSPAVTNQDVFFTANVTDPDQQRPVRRFVWNFGDGSSQTTTINSVSHDYDTAGTYSVLLTITDDQGNISTCTTSVTVTDSGGGGTDQCEVSANPSSATAGDVISFESTGPGGPPFNYDFGDGSTSGPINNSDGETTHQFGVLNNSVTVYTITMTATGTTISCTTQVTILPPP